jgi:SHS2 domain-containing protein
VTKNRYEEVEHTADIAIRVWGADLAELFANAAYGMACQLTDCEDVALTTSEEVELQAPDVEMLLVEWLSELLYLGERDDVVFVAFGPLEVTSHQVHAVARGGPIVERGAHIKAVTFSEMNVRKTDGEYQTIVVFDV